jgi:hypothetical protein
MPTGNLPESGKKLWEEVYQKAKKGSCKGDESCAAGSAWKAVHNAGWRKDADGNWKMSKSLTEFSMRIDRASYDKATGERRVRIVASDTDEDNRKDSMSLELFNDFIDRIKKNEPVPEEFQSDFWKGGEPYISVSHYSDLNGKGVPGIVDATYIDGSYLKSKGKFNDTSLGRKCFEAICSDLYGDTKDREDKVRISIAFLDYMHKHKSSGFVFDRLNAETNYCPECIMEILKGEGQGKIYLKGHLIHEALTRVPVNTRTSMEVDKSMADKILTRKDDASSIVGEDEAENLEELESKIVGKSDVLVTRAEEEAPGKAEEECKDAITGEIDPDCMAKKRGETPSTPEKSEAKDKEEEEEKPPKKKKVPADKEETKEEKAEFIRSIIKEMKAETEVIIPSPSHPLDAYFSEFKDKFDAIMASEVAENEKLQSIQEPFNILGTGIVSVVKSSIKPKEVTPEIQGQVDLVEALSKVMNPIAQKLDLVITKLSAPQVEKPMLPVPQRRSISPSVVQQAQQQQPVVKSETPNLRKLIEKTT